MLELTRSLASAWEPRMRFQGVAPGPVVARRALRRWAALSLTAVLVLAGADAGAQSAPAPTRPSAAAAAAAPEDGTTALEAWLARPGRVVVERTRVFPAIGLEGGARVELEAVVAFEPVREHERALGARVHLRGSERAGRAALAYLDPFEIDDLARTLAALPGLEELERASGAGFEIRHLGRDGFGLVVRVASGGATARRALRFGGDPPLDLAASDAALEELRQQLDAARRYLFDAPPGS